MRATGAQKPAHCAAEVETKEAGFCPTAKLPGFYGQHPNESRKRQPPAKSEPGKANGLHYKYI